MVGKFSIETAFFLGHYVWGKVTKLYSWIQTTEIHVSAWFVTVTVDCGALKYLSRTLPVLQICSIVGSSLFTYDLSKK